MITALKHTTPRHARAGATHMPYSSLTALVTVYHQAISKPQLIMNIIYIYNSCTSGGGKGTAMQVPSNILPFSRHIYIPPPPHTHTL